MEKKYLKVTFDLADSKKRNVTIKNLQKDCTDENLKSISNLVENFIDGTKKHSLKIEESILV